MSYNCPLHESALLLSYWLEVLENPREISPRAATEFIGEIIKVIERTVSINLINIDALTFLEWFLDKIVSLFNLLGEKWDENFESIMIMYRKLYEARTEAINSRLRRSVLLLWPEILVAILLTIFTPYSLMSLRMWLFEIFFLLNWFM